VSPRPAITRSSGYAALPGPPRKTVRHPRAEAIIAAPKTMKLSR
jgi:hypothetical protein